MTILKVFIAAESISKWKSHLDSIELIISFFHSDGHCPYAKAAENDLIDMLDLEEKMHPEEYKK